MNLEDFKSKQLNNPEVRDEYHRYDQIYDMVKVIGGPDMCAHIPTDDTVEIASALSIAANCIGTDIVDTDVTLKDQYVDLYLLVNVIAYRLAIGDLKLVEQADIGGKKAYYDKLIASAKKALSEIGSAEQTSIIPKRQAINIKWSVDNLEDLEHLPTVIDIPADMAEDDVADYISDLTGFCHYGFDLVQI